MPLIKESLWPNLAEGKHDPKELLSMMEHIFDFLAPYCGIFLLGKRESPAPYSFRPEFLG